MSADPRSRGQRRRDTEHRLTHDKDVWVASASADGAPYLVPLSFDWDDFFCQFRLHTGVALFLAEFAPKHVAGPRPSLTSPLGGASINGYLNSGRGAKTARE